MSTPTTGSPNITTLDSKITVSLCDGNFYVDISPSLWIAMGYNSVQGASVKITNPVGVIITNYPTSGFDILPPMTTIFSYQIPPVANNYQYGTYIIDVRLTDANGDSWVISKPVNICPPDPNNKNRKEGCLNATINGNCRTGKVIISLNQAPNYKGTIVTTQVNELTVEYPTASELTPFETTLGAFSLQLFEGQYKVTGTVCALYPYGDNIFFKVQYKIKCEKIIRCIIDECCVFAKLNELRLKSIADCTQVQKDETASIVLNAIFLFRTAELAAQCGEDPSDIIGDMETLLGCACTCNCNEGTPIIGNNGANGYLYRGVLSQDGTAAPTASVSSLNAVAIQWAYTSAGLYIGTISGLATDLTEDNTFVIINSASFVTLSPTSQSFIKAGYYSVNSIYVRSNDLAGNPANALLNNTPIEFTII